MTPHDSPVLHVAGRPVARYVTRPEPSARLSPRPYLHPVTTLAGTAVTELSPADHTHHLGVGVGWTPVGHALERLEPDQEFARGGAVPHRLRLPGGRRRLGAAHPALTSARRR